MRIFGIILLGVSLGGCVYDSESVDSAVAASWHTNLSLAEITTCATIEYNKVYRRFPAQIETIVPDAEYRLVPSGRDIRLVGPNTHRFVLKIIKQENGFLVQYIAGDYSRDQNIANLNGCFI